MAPTPLTSRKLDTVYFVFFVTHIPVMLIVDLSGYYPSAIQPQFTSAVRNYYKTTFRDRFFISPPLWFHAYVLLEFLYHIPLSVWAAGALLRDDPMVPVHLLVFAVVVAMTTLTCLVDMFSWPGYDLQERLNLCTLYVPYLGLALLMGLDMMRRLRSIVLTKAKAA